MDEGSVKTMLYLFDEYTKAQQWSQRKLSVIVDEGALSTEASIERMGPLRDKLLGANIYPVFVVWQTPWFAELDHEMRTWIEHGDRTPAGTDQHVVARAAAARSRGRAAWCAIADRSSRAMFARHGGARALADAIAYKRGQRDFDRYTVSFGAGDLLAGPLATHLPTPVTGAVAIAPLTTMAQFASTYGDMLVDGCMRHLTVVTLEAEAQHADGFGGSPASVTDVVSEVWALPGRSMRQGARAANVSGEWSVDPVPLLGLARDLGDDEIVARLARADRLTLRAVADTGHLDLPVSPSVHDLLIEQMTAKISATTPAAAMGLPPRDPLAAAELHRSLNTP